MKRSNLILAIFLATALLFSCNLSKSKKFNVAIKVEDAGRLSSDSVMNMINRRVCNAFDLESTAITNGSFQNGIYTFSAHLPGKDSTAAKKIKGLFGGRGGSVGFWVTYENNQALSWIFAVNDTLQKGLDLPPLDPNEILRRADSIERFEKLNPVFKYFRPNSGLNGESILNKACAGVCKIKDTLELMKIFRSEKAKAIFPKDLNFMWGKTMKDEILKDFMELYCLKHDPSSKGPSLELGQVIKSEKVKDENNGYIYISFTMNKRDGAMWAYITKNNIGRTIAISVNGMIASAPIVQAAITGGESQITGNFTDQEAEDLAMVIRNGKLPFKAKVVSVEEVK